MSDIDDAKAICNQLQQLSIEAGRGEWVRDATEYVHAAAIDGAPHNSGYLRSNIFYDVEQGEDETVTGLVYTNVEYANYVELGTGPRGAAEHSGISPEAHPAYTMSPWWIHESQLDIGVAEMYHWPFIDTKEGRFYKCSGQPAQPFLYPALKDNVDTVVKIANEGLEKVMEELEE